MTNFRPRGRGRWGDRPRTQRIGEACTVARRRLVTKRELAPDLAKSAGVSDSPVCRAAVVRSATPNRRMRLAWDDGTAVLAGFVSKGDSRSGVAIEHQGLRDRAASEARKKAWSEAFDRLGRMLS